jgi:hypothetical protein
MNFSPRIATHSLFLCSLVAFTVCIVEFDTLFLDFIHNPFDVIGFESRNYILFLISFQFLIIYCSLRHMVNVQ